MLENCIYKKGFRRYVYCMLFMIVLESNSYSQLSFNNLSTEVVLKTKEENLILKKQGWNMKLVRNGQLIFEEAQLPEFLINGQWVSFANIKNVSKQTNGNLVLRLENNGNTAKAIINVVNGNVFHIRILPGEKATAIKLHNHLGENEQIYGFGEMWDGSVGQRGKSVELWDINGTPDECAFIPYYISTSNYCYFLNYGGKVKADVGKAQGDQLTLEAPASEVDILLTAGKDIPTAVKQYLAVTGMPVMPPRWSFKPWFWLMSAYDKPRADISTLNAREVLKGAHKFKELDIPASVTWLEPPWQTARTSFKPSDQFSKDFKGFVDSLHQLGLKVLCWTVPYTLPSSPNWEEGSSNNFLVKKIGGELPKAMLTPSGEMIGAGYQYIDFTKEAARKWWQAQISKVVSLGIDGFKLDAGQDLPEDALLSIGAGKDLRNSFARYYNQTFYEALQAKKPGNFLTIPRAAWAGANKYLVFKWPGDLSTSFEENGLPSSVYSSISIGFSGFPFVSTDIGGFSPRPSPEGVWVRWAQFGAMLPGMQTPNMPWWYSEKALHHYRYLSWLHTDLIPFWMSLAHEAHQTGAPIVRHLIWTFPNDKTAVQTDDEYTLGSSLLVAPVITSENSRKVYLPQGRWYDIQTNEITIGPKNITWSGDLYHFPLYAREGAIIPMEVENEVSGFGTENSKGYVTIAAWPVKGKMNSFTLHDTEAPVSIQMSEPNSRSIKFRWRPSRRNYIFRVKTPVGFNPASIHLSGQPVNKSTMEKFNLAKTNAWYFDDAKGLLWIKAFSKSTQNLLQIVSSLK
jgi:alpha-D-xyloside xylohydrolase